MTYAAYDFGADTRGYTWGVHAELDFDDWAIRAARILIPVRPNQLELETRFLDYYADQLEIEHAHEIAGMPGAARLLAFRNRANMGRFDDAVAAWSVDPSRNATTCPDFSYGSANAMAPDLCWARKPNVKWGIGLNFEQLVYRDIGVFFRGMISDGQSEVYAFSSADRSIALGGLARGSLWGRPKDYTGIGVGVAWISDSHAEYLRLGGIDGFIGDGALNQAAESVFELFYGMNILSSIWMSLDYQLITNPAYNADRGPVSIFGGRFHAEF
jgi:hypothetical protein